MTKDYNPPNPTKNRLHCDGHNRWLADNVSAKVKIGENVSLCSDNGRLPVWR